MDREIFNVLNEDENNSNDSIFNIICCEFEHAMHFDVMEYILFSGSKIILSLQNSNDIHMYITSIYYSINLNHILTFIYRN